MLPNLQSYVKQSTVINRCRILFFVVIANSLVLAFLSLPLTLPLLLLAIGVTQARYFPGTDVFKYLPTPLNPIEVVQRLYKSVPLRNVIQYDQNCFKVDRQLIYAPKPNSVCEQSNLEYKVKISFGIYGQRGYSSQLSKPPSILAVGDSHAMGWGVSDHEVFTNALSSKGFNSLNLAVSSYGTAREISRLIRFADSHPDMYRKVPFILFVYNPNDFGENLRYLSMVGSQSSDEPSLLASYKASLGNANPYHFSHDTSPSVYALDGKNAARVVSEYWKSSGDWALQVLGKANSFSKIVLKSLAGSRGLPPASNKQPMTDADLFFRLVEKHLRYFAGKTILIVVSDDWGLRNSEITNDFIEKCNSVCAKMGSVDFHILHPKDTGLIPGSPSYYAVDDHLSPLGHQRLAAALAARMRHVASASKNRI